MTDKFPVTPRLVQSTEATTLAVSGWYLPGDDVSLWLVAIASSSPDHLFVAPKSLANPIASGLLGLSHKAPVKVPLGAIPLVGWSDAKSTSRLWLPYQSRLTPARSVNAMLEYYSHSQTKTLVWLAHCGLIGLTDLDAITAGDLTKPSQPIPRDWSTPPPTIVLPDRITDIAMLRPPSIDDIFAPVRGEIGGDEQSLERLRGDGSMAGDGVLNRAWESLRNTFEAMSPSALQARREQQLAKMLELMKRDPDKALRMAIPINDLMLFRGIGKSGWRLMESMTDFSFGKLFGGGGAADPWNIDGQTQAKLRAAYREQANREVGLGRFRRAAYIHAHLLGDLSTAAMILEQGKFYNEAALLFGEKLNRPADQARCLVLAGQVGEAATIYERLNNFIAAGDAWSKFGETDRARQLYEKAVTWHLSKQELVAAATVLDGKLGDRERAEELIWKSWPTGEGTLDAARLGFRWLGESGRHGEARKRLGNLVTRSDTMIGLDQLTTLTSELARDYPENELREYAEDRCRISLATKIAGVSDSQLHRRMELMRSLAPGDSLLQRDTRTFATREIAQIPKLAPTKSQHDLGDYRMISTVALSQSRSFFTAEMVGNELFALAQHRDWLSVNRISNLLDEKPVVGQAVVSSPRELGKMPVGYCLHEGTLGVTIELSFLGEAIAYSEAKLAGPTATCKNWELRESLFVGEWCGAVMEGGIRISVNNHRDTLSLRHTNGSTTLDIDASIAAVMVQMGSEGALRTMSSLGSAQLIVVGSHAVLSVGQLLLLMKSGELRGLAMLIGQPFGFAKSMPHTPPRIAVATGRSLEVIWLEDEERRELVCPDDHYLRAVFLPGGQLLAATQTHLKLYRRTRDVTRLVDQMAWSGEEIVAMMPVGAKHFAVLHRNGQWYRFQKVR